jgi:hypothetical protein
MRAYRQADGRHTLTDADGRFAGSTKGIGGNIARVVTLNVPTVTPINTEGYGPELTVHNPLTGLYFEVNLNEEANLDNPGTRNNDGEEICAYEVTSMDALGGQNTTPVVWATDSDEALQIHAIMNLYSEEAVTQALRVDEIMHYEPYIDIHALEKHLSEIDPALVGVIGRIELGFSDGPGAIMASSLRLASIYMGSKSRQVRNVTGAAIRDLINRPEVTDKHVCSVSRGSSRRVPKKETVSMLKNGVPREQVILDLAIEMRREGSIFFDGETTLN